MQAAPDGFTNETGGRTFAVKINVATEWHGRSPATRMHAELVTARLSPASLSSSSPAARPNARRLYLS